MISQVFCRKLGVKMTKLDGTPSIALDQSLLRCKLAERSRVIHTGVLVFYGGIEDLEIVDQRLAHCFMITSERAPLPNPKSTLIGQAAKLHS